MKGLMFLRDMTVSQLCSRVEDDILLLAIEDEAECLGVLCRLRIVRSCHSKIQ